MPVMTISCVWASRVTWNVGSSLAILARLPEIFCSSPRALGSTARPNIGVGNAGAGSFGGWAWLLTVSPMCRSSTLATATMSPGTASVSGVVLLPCTSNRPPVRADLSVRPLTSGWSALYVPS